MESNVELSYERGQKEFPYPKDENRKSGSGSQKIYEPETEVSQNFFHNTNSNCQTFV